MSGLASAFSPNLYVLLLFRGGVGFAVGGAFVGLVSSDVRYDKICILPITIIALFHRNTINYHGIQIA